MTSSQSSLVKTKPMPLGFREDTLVSNLLLDPNNPRLSAAEPTTDQAELTRRLWVEMAVDELVYSIAYNSYYKTEPLLVVQNSEGQAGPDLEKMVVIEGNRRLAAVKILVDDHLRETLKITSAPTITEAAKAQLAASQ